MNSCGMLAPHRNGHTTYLAGKRAAPHQAAAMQGLNGGTFVDTKFTQTLRFAGRECFPLYTIDIGRATGGQ
jgi:hypothetical protein